MVIALFSSRLSPFSEMENNNPYRVLKTMRFLSCVLLVLGFQASTFSQQYEIPEQTKRIVFLGNSITYQGSFIHCIDAFLELKSPESKYEIINLGLPSETVSGLSEPNHANGEFPRPDLHERLQRVLDQTKPDLVIANYGMNDGIYLPFDEGRFGKFKEGMIWLHESVEKSGAKIIHVTPPVFDERKDPAYANVLDIYSSWLVSMRYTHDWEVIDLHWPMRKALEDHRKENPEFAFAEDGVHPNADGHFLMAKEILIGLGMNEIEEKEHISQLLNHKNGEEILNLISQRQTILRDAWLRSTGHLRPGLATGLPMEEAQKKVNQLNQEIRELIK